MNDASPIESSPTIERAYRMRRTQQRVAALHARIDATRQRR